MLRTLKCGLVVALGTAMAAMATANPLELTGEAGPARVQNRAAEPAPDFGNSSTYYSTVDGYGFIPDSNSMLYEHGATSGGFYCRAGDPERRAAGQVLVPHGVRLRIMSVWGHDSTATSLIQARLRKSCLPDFASGFPSTATLATVATTNAFSAGDFYDFDNFDTSNETADNQSCTYAVILDFGAGGCPSTQSLGVYKVRVRWQRQTPPAPAVATFSDVPTSDPFFQSIEALAASGITAGCGGGNFCPTLPVTRAAMAAFLARALGLPRESYTDLANP